MHMYVYILIELSVRLFVCSHFDAHGNYYVDDTEIVQDNWLTDVDWNKVREDGTV